MSSNIFTNLHIYMELCEHFCFLHRHSALKPTYNTSNSKHTTTEHRLHGNVLTNAFTPKRGELTTNASFKHMTQILRKQTCSANPSLYKQAVNTTAHRSYTYKESKSR